MLGNFIKKLRKEKGYSQDYVAKKLDLSRPTFAQIEKGEKSITVEEATKLASIFGMTLEDLLKKATSRGMRSGLCDFVS